MGPLSRVIGSGIGYAVEANAARKSKSSKSPDIRAGEQTQEQEAIQRDDGTARDDDGDIMQPGGAFYENLDESDGEEHDEQDWLFDEIQREEALPSYGAEDTFENAHGVDDVVEIFFQRHHPPAYQANEHEALPCPVIIPQRRPGARTRGFVRAYAPNLEACGINQATFLDFELGFEKAIKLSPFFHAMQLVVVAVDKAVLFTAGFMPIMKLVSLAAHTSIELSRKTYMNVKYNSYLDQMNEKLFKPLGLYAMVVKFEKSHFHQDPELETIDVTSKTTSDVGDRVSGKNEHFYSSSGARTHSEFELPEVCPLIFPELEALPEDKKENAFKRIGHGLQDYGDRKARARFAAANTDGTNEKLDVLPPPEFASRFSDPNHPARSGGFVNLVTGGVINRPTLSDRVRARHHKAIESRAARRERVLGARQAPVRDTVRQIRGKDDIQYDEHGNPIQKQNRQKGGIMKRLLQESTLYLMIVNMPTDEEVQEAKAELVAAKEADKHRQSGNQAS